MTIIDTRGRSARDDRWEARGASRTQAGLRAHVVLAALPLLAGGVLLGRGDVPEEQSGAVVAPPAVALEVRLPLQVNRRVERWVDRFQTDQRPAFQRLLDRRGLYAEMIRGKLSERGMPEELLYLAMMESGLSPTAVSHASAVGLWQFMTPTAQQYGLRVDAWVDERRDPVRATDAALDYLAWLHDRYGSWYLAAAAYNAGPGRVDRVLARHAGGRTGDESLYWEVLTHLPLETREYVPRLIAATLLGEDAGRYGFTGAGRAPYAYDRVFVPGGTSLRRVAASLDVDLRGLRSLNPHLVRGVTPPLQTYPLRVPTGAAPQVVASLARGSRSRLADD